MLADGLDVGCERRRGGKETGVTWPEQLEVWSFHQLTWEGSLENQAFKWPS